MRVPSAIIAAAALACLTGCAEEQKFDPEKYADAAEEVVWARANSLSEAHPHRMDAEENLKKLTSANPSENRAALQARIRKLNEARKDQRKNQSEAEKQLGTINLKKVTIDGLKDMLHDLKIQKWESRPAD